MEVPLHVHVLDLLVDQSVLRVGDRAFVVLPNGNGPADWLVEDLPRKLAEVDILLDELMATID
jgi:hypothetical protein